MNLLFYLVFLTTTIIINGQELFDNEIEPSSSANTGIKCDSESKDQIIDQLTARAINIGTGEDFPTDRQSMKLFCRQRAADLAQLERYKNACTTGNLKQTLTLFAYSVRRTFNSLCTSIHSKRTQYIIAAGNCLNAASIGLKKCHNDALKLVVTAQYLDQTKRKVGQMCCSYTEFLSCAQDTLTAFPVCTEKHTTTILNLIREGIDNTANMLCGEYTEYTDKCSQFKFTRKGKAAAENYKSVVLPAINIVNSL